MSAWEPYTQVLTTLNGALSGVTTGWTSDYFAAYQVESESALDHQDIAANSSARECARYHAIAGESGLLFPWASMCPTPSIGSFIYGPQTGFMEAGMQTDVGYYTYTSRYTVTAYQAGMAIAADRTPRPSGLESWQDPTVLAPPASEVIGGRTVEWQYAPFTALRATVRFGDALTAGSVSHAINEAGVPFTVNARQVTYAAAPAGWVWPPSGPVLFGLSVDAAGNVSAFGQQELPDITSGVRWSVLASTTENELGDAGRPVPPAASARSVASCVPRFTVYRTGRRRTGVAPPLHQRARTDGLGGGPMHQSPGLASRQLGGRARGTY